MSELHSLVAPYALDALNESDARSFEEHLALCERCREELAGAARGGSGPRLRRTARGPARRS